VLRSLVEIEQARDARRPLRSRSRRSAQTGASGTVRLVALLGGRFVGAWSSDPDFR
jgi:hypothetical protein